MLHKLAAYLSPKTTGSSNPMDVELSIVWKIIIYHQGNLRKLNAKTPNKLLFNIFIFNLER